MRAAHWYIFFRYNLISQVYITGYYIEALINIYVKFVVNAITCLCPQLDCLGLKKI